MSSEELIKRIEINPKIMFGKPVIKNTRLIVEIVLEKLSQGASHEDIIAVYPFITRDDILACLLYAAHVISLQQLTAAEKDS